MENNGPQACVREHACHSDPVVFGLSIVTGLTVGSTGLGNIKQESLRVDPKTLNPESLNPNENSEVPASEKKALDKNGNGARIGPGALCQAPRAS